MIKKINDHIQDFNHINELGKLSIVSRSKELYEFSIEQREVNFNDLYERLDDNTLLTNTIISDMNVVSKFFNNLNERIQELNNDSIAWD